MGGHEDGPFPHFKDDYGVDGAHIRTQTTSPGQHAQGLATLSSNLSTDAKRSAYFVQGAIQAPVLLRPRRPASLAGNLAANGLFACALMNDFALDADSYDLAVDDLNRRHRTQVNQRISGLMHEPEYRHGEATIDREGISAAVEASLLVEFRRVRGKLDSDASGIVTRFNNGPTDAAVKDLMLRGLIPMAAATVYPSVQLTPAEQRLAEIAAGYVGQPVLPGTLPAEVKKWWDSLDPAARAELIKRNPEFVGNTDGIPAADRDVANRSRLPNLIKQQEAYVRDHPDDAAAAKDLRGLKALDVLLHGDDESPAHPGYQLLLLDDHGHPLKAAVANGNVDQADIVSTWIGGTTSSVEGFGGDMTKVNNLSAEVRHQLNQNGDSRTQVGILWLGYDAPDAIVDPGRKDAALAEAKQAWKEPFLPGHQGYLDRATSILLADGGDTQDAINTRFARDGGPSLAQFAEGIQATNPGARQTAGAHSYGGAVLGDAAQRTDAYSTITVSGAPGMFGQKASDFHVSDGVYVSEAQWRDQDYAQLIAPGGRLNVEGLKNLVTDGGDFVPDIGDLDGRFGKDPSDMSGVRNFDNGAATIDGRNLTSAHGHSSYWDRNGHALYNEANAVIGAHDKVSTR